MAEVKEYGCDVLLVGCEEEENLGLRYIASYLASRGVGVGIEPFHRSAHAAVLARVRRDNPALVGFSVIFQRMLPEFADLIAFLRDKGVTAHFTCGGHFPTMEPEATLKHVPGLDSVVRHEGEETTLDLYRRLGQPETWDRIEGLAYRRDGRVGVNPPRPLVADLDGLPFPMRGESRFSIRGMNVSSLIASRGCYFDCSFCSVQTFYREPPGPKRRSRTPGNVAREMEELFHEYGARIFIFKDDDLGTKGRRQGEWISGFARELERRGLAGKILFRMSSRVDEFDADRLARLKDAGLAALYVGIESGNEQGLRACNKKYSVDDVHRSLDLLHRLDIPYEFGFMIFEPGSTFETVAADIAFLKRVGAAGAAVVDFTKMLPYAGTPIARRLKEAGRLEGTLVEPDYGYGDPRMSLLQAFYSQAFHHRNFEGPGLVNRLRLAKLDAAVVAKFFGDEYDGAAYAENVRELVRWDNAEALETMSLAVHFMGARAEKEIIQRWEALEYFSAQLAAAEAAIGATLDALMRSYGFEMAA